MLRDRFPDLAIGAAIVFAAAANASTPPEDIPVDEWAGRFRYVAAESGSAHPGLWNNRLTPYAVKPMRVMSPSHPARRVAVSGSAQTLKSELMLNAIFTMIATAPANSMMVLPSIDEVGNWNRTKWRPNVKVTPAVNDRVIPERSRDENASTGAIKEYLGGKLFIVTAGSSKGLQAKSIKNLYFDEISEFPEDTKDRGDPIDQARHRQDGQGDETKELAASTPKELPNCRITKMVASGTLEKYYIACPHCGHYQQLTFDNFQAEELAPWFICAANGCVIEETRKHGFLQYGYHGGKLHPSWRRREPLVAEVRRAERELESFLVDRELERKDRAEGFDVSTGPAEEINLQISKARYQLNAIKRELDDLDDAVAAILPGAEWLATFQSEDPDNPPPPEHFPPEELGRWLNRDTEGREPSFHIWQAYSTLKPWSKIAVEWREADGDPIKKKTFCQQVLAEAYEATGEAPDHEKLYNRRSENYALGGVPFGYWILTGAADIQSDRIEACVWAWGPGWSSFLVAREVFKGKPQNEHDDCWKKLGEFRMRTFEGENGFQFPITLFAVDAGYATYDVYRFCNGRANTLAVDGRDERSARFSAPLGPPKRIKKAPARPGRKARPAADLYPVGAHQLKEALYQGLSALNDLSVEQVKAGEFPAGAVRFPGDVTEADLKQLTAEYLAPEKKKNGKLEKSWVKKDGQANEMLDMYVYSRAMAFHAGVGRYKREDWEAIAADRGGAADPKAGGLEKMWQAAGFVEPPESKSQPAKVARTARGRGVRGRSRR